MKMLELRRVRKYEGGVVVEEGYGFGEDESICLESLSELAHALQSESYFNCEKVRYLVVTGENSSVDCVMGLSELESSELERLAVILTKT